MSEIFAAWTNNCRGRADKQLYIIHAFQEHCKAKTLCGCEIQEVGNAITSAEVSCRRCQNTIILKENPSP